MPCSFQIVGLHANVTVVMPLDITDEQYETSVDAIKNNRPVVLTTALPATNTQGLSTYPNLLA